jgi:hypothetical protein
VSWAQQLIPSRIAGIKPVWVCPTHDSVGAFYRIEHGLIANPERTCTTAAVYDRDNRHEPLSSCSRLAPLSQPTRLKRSDLV